MLVAKADGAATADEVAAAGRSLHLTERAPDESEFLAAAYDVAALPRARLLAEVAASLHIDGRRRALEVACQVANADGRIAWAETKLMVELKAALGLPERDVRRIVKKAWGEPGTNLA